MYFVKAILYHRLLGLLGLLVDFPLMPLSLLPPFPVGVLDGMAETLGASLGSSLGLVVGAEEKALLGAREGTADMEGTEEGALLKFRVGTADMEGAEEGALLGAEEGASEGEEEGTELGKALLLPLLLPLLSLLSPLPIFALALGDRVPFPTLSWRVR